MNRQFRLAGVLRVRRLQEDVARGAVARSQSAVTTAEVTADRRALRLAERPRPASGSTTAFVTEMAGLRAMAAGISQAEQLAGQAQAALQLDTDAWAAARGRTRGLDRLAERHTADLAAHDIRTAQAEVDDLVGSRFRSGGPL